MAEKGGTTISKLTLADLDAVDELMKPNTGTIGFLPRAALEDYLRNRSVLGAKAQDGQLIGYLLYAAYTDRFRITQLCVREEFRNKGLARKLLDALKATATTQKVIWLRCRSDFEAHLMWGKLGFVPSYESPGRSRYRLPLTLWYLPLALDDQYSLFRANLSDDVLDVVIDANVFFDLDEPDNEATQLSKALLSDLYVDSLNLWYTDELLTEINRNPSQNERDAARARASNLIKVQHDPHLVENYEQALRGILPSSNDTQVSDIRHLAKTAASDLGVFVTNDRNLLKNSKRIANALSVELLSPTTLILRLGELSKAQAQEPDRVAGLSLQWQHSDSSAFEAFPFDVFLEEGERLNQLRGRVSSALVDGPHNELEVLWSERRPVAFRVLSHDTAKDTLTIALGRLARSREASLLGRFLIADTIYRAVRKNLSLVKFKESALPLSSLQGVSEMGFQRCRDEFIRFNSTRYLDRSDTLGEIAKLAPQALSHYQSKSSLELERSCSPLTLESGQNHFLIPIRPGYALNLFDRQRSSQDMFGGNPSVLLRWSNVYYRAATHHKMLKAPGRILWYESGNRKELVGVSHLDEVVIAPPKELFQRFKKHGTLEWKDLYEMCGRDIAKELMVLQFSHTFPFKRPVPLAEVWKVFDEYGIGRSLQSPRKIPFDTFNMLFQLGFQEQS